jgi:hypothetical protein
MESSLLKDQERARQLLEELTAARESLLAKGKVLADQEALLAEGRKIVLEEQKRFVGWEKTLNEREESMARRSSIPAATTDPEPEPVSVYTAPEPEPVPEPPSEPAMDPEPIVAAPEAAPPEEETPTPVFKAEPAAEEEEAPTPVYRAEEKPAGPVCPKCSSPVSEQDAKCANCGHVLKEAHKPAEEKERSEAKEDASKKPVSIRKIIRRK